MRNIDSETTIAELKQAVVEDYDIDIRLRAVEALVRIGSEQAVVALRDAVMFFECALGQIEGDDWPVYQRATSGLDRVLSQRDR